MAENTDKTRQELMLAELAAMRGKGVIDADAEERIRRHYAAAEPSPEPQPVVWTEPDIRHVAPQKAPAPAKRGILSYFVKALGMYLAFSVSASFPIAVNLVYGDVWDTLSTSQRVLFAFMPVIAGALCGVYTIVREKGRVWREASAVLTAFGFAMLAWWSPEIYHAKGSPGSSEFVMFVSLPLIYIFRSHLLAALYCAFFLLGCLLSGLGVPLLRMVFNDSESGFACFMGVVPFIAYHRFFRKPAGKETVLTGHTGGAQEGKPDGEGGARR